MKPRTDTDLIGIGLLREVTERFGVALSGKTEEMLVDYVEALLSWNEKHNLISRADTANIWPRHIIHSLFPVLLFTVPANLRFIDIGTGGGLPGLPIAILRPDLQGVLVDSVRKKTEALQAIIKSLGITNITVVTDRVEGASFVKRFQSSFDLAFARAVAPLPDLVKWSTRLLKNRKKERTNSVEGGTTIRPPAIVALKGGDLTTEIAGAHRMFPHLSITEYPISLNGVSGGFFTDKKIVIVNC